MRVALIAALAVLAATPLATIVSAAPGGGIGVQRVISHDTTLIEQVHGTHRSCVRGRRWHRHSHGKVRPCLPPGAYRVRYRSRY